MGDRLLNKVAVVTGASGLLGRAIVQRFIAEGAKVVAFARDRGRLDELAALSPARIVAIDGDVTRPDDLDTLALSTVRRFGGVDILVPAATLFRRAVAAEISQELVAELFAVNVRGTFQTVRTFLRHLNPGASIVFLAGSSGHSTIGGMGGFAASQAAVSSLSRTLAVELFSRKIRVNCVAPGPSVFGREPPPEAAPTRSKSAADESPPLVDDVAEAVLFFASDALANLTGQEIVVDRPSPPNGSARAIE